MEKLFEVLEVCKEIKLGFILRYGFFYSKTNMNKSFFYIIMLNRNEL